MCLGPVFLQYCYAFKGNLTTYELTFNTILLELDATKAVELSSRHRNATVILYPCVQITLVYQVLLLLHCVCMSLYVCQCVCPC